MNNKKSGKTNVSTAASRRRESRPVRGPSSSNAEPADDAGKHQEMKEELPSRSREATKFPLQAMVDEQDGNRLCAQIGLAPDGNTLIIDTNSTVIVNTEVVKKMKELADSAPITLEMGNVGVNNIQGIKSERWFEAETEHFFLALKMLGTNFYLMAKFFPGRNRTELYRKFKREESIQPDVLEVMMNNRVPFDEELLKAGPRRMEAGKPDPRIKPGSGKKQDPSQIKPGSDKTLSNPMTRKKAAQQRALERPPIPRKRPCSKKIDDTLDSTSAPPKKKQRKEATYQPDPLNEGLKIIPRISNIVCTFNLGTEIDFKKVLSTLKNVEFDPAFSSRVTLHLDYPKTSAYIFRNGKVTCFGASTLESARLATRMYARLIQSCGFPLAKYRDFKVITISATKKLKFLINLKKLARNNAEFCEYEPQRMPFAKWEMKDPKVSLNIATSGSINLFGGKTMEQVCQAYEQIVEIVEKYKK